jgi:hypothetical protein
VTGPVRQFVQCRAVVACCVLESVFRRQVDAVLGTAVECAIRLVMSDVRAGVVQDLLTRLIRATGKLDQ